MIDVLILGVILVLFAINLFYTIVWWQQYKDLRAARAVVTGVALLVGAVALAIANWALEGDLGPDEIVEVVRRLVDLGKGVLLMVGIMLIYSALRERGRG